MTYSLKYIADSKGRHRAIQISLKDWKKIEQKLQEADFLTRLRRGLDQALEEVSLHRQGKRKLKTLDDLLAEG